MMKKATKVETFRDETGLYFDITYETVEDIAIKKTKEFLDEFAPYEADESIDGWAELIKEEPHKALETLDDMGKNFDPDEKLEELYNAMYDAIYECCMCRED